MIKRKLALLFFSVFVVFIFGCTSPTPEQSLIKKVNTDDKSFKGEWVYKSQIAGQFTYAVRARLYVEVNKEKFHLIVKWTEANPPDRRGVEEWIYDGKILWQIIPSQKQVSYLKVKSFKKGPFWKMPLQLKPLAPPKEIDKDTIAKRICKVLQTKGKYEGADVTLTYWIDEEKNILLKKEHLLEKEGLVLIHESYECKNIEFNPVFSEKNFEVKIPADWVKVKKQYLDCEFLNTKF